MGFASELHRNYYEGTIGQSLPMQGALEGLKLAILSAAELKFPTPPRNSQVIDGDVGMDLLLTPILTFFVSSEIKKKTKSRNSEIPIVQW